MVAIPAISLCIFNRNAAEHLQSALLTALAQFWLFAVNVLVLMNSESDKWMVAAMHCCPTEDQLL
jgi:hypothetical protein